MINQVSYQDGGGEVDVENGLASNLPGLHGRSTHQEGHAYVHVEGEGLALNEAELAQMIAMIRCVEHVRVLQLPEGPQLLV